MSNYYSNRCSSSNKRPQSCFWFARTKRCTTRNGHTERPQKEPSVQNALELWAWRVAAFGRHGENTLLYFSCIRQSLYTTVNAFTLVLCNFPVFLRPLLPLDDFSFASSFALPALLPPHRSLLCVHRKNERSFSSALVLFYVWTVLPARRDAVCGVLMCVDIAGRWQIAMRWSNAW